MPRRSRTSRAHMVARAMYREISEGRGSRAQDYLHLDLTHLGRSDRGRLPDITGFVRTYLGIDAVRAPIPVQPTAHYLMGGIPTDLNARVIIDENSAPLPGLYAAGDAPACRCMARTAWEPIRLVDILVFGRALAAMPRGSLPKMIGRCCLRAPTSELRTWFAGSIRRRRRTSARLLRPIAGHDDAGRRNLRTAKGLEAAQDKIRELREGTAIHLDDDGMQYNMDLLKSSNSRTCSIWPR